MLSLRLFVFLLLRYAQRALLSLLLNEPPRNTRQLSAAPATQRELSSTRIIYPCPKIRQSRLAYGEIPVRSLRSRQRSDFQISRVQSDQSAEVGEKGAATTRKPL